MKGKLLAFNHAVIFFGATLYCGVLWALRFFWFPTWHNLKVDNYYEQFVPQTDAATKFFTIVVPVMFLALVIMIVSEWKTPMRWWAIAAFLLLGSATFVGAGQIIPVNKTLKTHITDQAVLSSLLEKWISLNQTRWILLTLMWIVLMLYFIIKGDLVEKLSAEHP